MVRCRANKQVKINHYPTKKSTGRSLSAIDYGDQPALPKFLAAIVLRLYPVRKDHEPIPGPQRDRHGTISGAGFKVS
jgi:hypothetical protein